MKADSNYFRTHSGERYELKKRESQTRDKFVGSGGSNKKHRLARHYLPKSKDLSNVTDELLERIEYFVNHRPKKRAVIKHHSKSFSEDLPEMGQQG